MNLCNYLKSFFYQTTTINDSNLDNLIVEKIDNKVDYVVDSQKIDNKVKYKSCFQKIKTIIKWSLLHSLRNNISNSNPEKRLSLLIYLLSWFFVVFGLLFTCLVYFPSFCEIATGLIAASIIFDKLFLEIKINRQSISKYIFSILMFIFTYYLFIKFYRESLLNNLSHNLDIELLISIVCLVIFSFSIGFMMEAYFFWKKNRAKLNIIIGTLAAFISFFSLYFGRCIFVKLTGIEPSIFSRSVIIFSVPIGILLWCFLSILILLFIYFLTLFVGINEFNFLSLIVSILKVTDHSWYKFWLRKPKELTFDKNFKKVKTKLTLFLWGTSIGVASSVALPFIVLDTLAHTNTFASISQADLMNAAEEIIVYIDYRPQEKFTECTNLEKSEWGLLVNNTKISVAQPQKSGGYIFKTKSCLFNDGDVTNL